MGRRLNLGCGRDLDPDAVNVDIALLPGIGAVVDPKGALPFADASFTEVVCLDVLEHVEDLSGTLREVHRVLVPGGLATIRSCHFSSRYLWEDPTHRRGFSFLTLDFYCRNGRHALRDYYFDFAFDQVEHTLIELPHERGFRWQRPLERLINLNNHTRSFYELGGLRSLFPAGNVSWVLRKG